MEVISIKAKPATIGLAGVKASVTFLKQEDSEASASPFPSYDGRPCFVQISEWIDYPVETFIGFVKGGHAGIEKTGKTRRAGPGVYWCPQPPGTKPCRLQNNHVCGPLSVEAMTRDATENNSGVLLEFTTKDETMRQVAIPAEMIVSDGPELRKMLAGMHLYINPDHGRELNRYIAQQHTKKRLLAASTVGWHGDTFVMPDGNIGPNADGIVLQSSASITSRFSRAGSLAGWRDTVAAMAAGNPLLTLAISAAFAGPLLRKVGQQGGGVHFFGNSSTGKTKLLSAACSVWGSGDSSAGFMRNWNATSNGMEASSVSFNDCLMALDEIKQCDAREVSKIVYAVSNGQGKQRMTRDAGARESHQWRVFLLSNGERTMQSIMAEAKKDVHAGQEIRMLELHVNRKFGAWDCLHRHYSGAEFSDALYQATITNYGHAGPKFIEGLSSDKRELKLPEIDVSGANGGQAVRAADRFRLTALAGELATEYGLTGWEPGEATAAASECYQLWLAGRGSGNAERRQILEAVADFIGRHGNSRRFPDLTDRAIEHNDVRDAQNQAGWRKNNSGCITYLFSSAGLKEALQGFDFNPALGVLEAAGGLITAAGRRQQRHRVPDGNKGFYVIDPEKL